MNKFFTKKLSIISFIFIPIIFLWHPNWLGFLGVQPYWPLFWLLPWSMINGSINGLIFGLFLGLILDSITLNESFTQVPGLIFCGFLFGRIQFHHHRQLKIMKSCIQLEVISKQIASHTPTIWLEKKLGVARTQSGVTK